MTRRNKKQQGPDSTGTIRSVEEFWRMDEETELYHFTQGGPEASLEWAASLPGAEYNEFKDSSHFPTSLDSGGKNPISLLIYRSNGYPYLHDAGWHAVRGADRRYPVIAPAAGQGILHLVLRLEQ